MPRMNIAARATNLPRVSSAPSTRSVVIRGTRQSAGPAAIGAVTSPSVNQAPAAVPMAAVPPASPEPEGSPAPGAPVPAPSPRTSISLPQRNSGVGQIPDPFRVGYPQYLRTATTSDLLAAALPGVAGIAGFTLVGAYAGYRQAKALQRALLAPVPTSILL